MVAIAPALHPIRAAVQTSKDAVKSVRDNQPLFIIQKLPNGDTRFHRRP